MPSLFDVEQFRHQPLRQVTVRRAGRATLVLGSTQPAELVDEPKRRLGGVDLARRRGGGGAVLLRPDDHLWVDAWVPSDDPLWSHDVSTAAWRIGTWWRSALEAAGVGDCSVHEGRAVPGQFGRLVCFAGRGPGEVFWRERKVVGLSQWRSRQGALFSGCCYAHWDPAPLVELLDLDPSSRASLPGLLAPLAVGLSDLPASPALPALGEMLVVTFPAWSSDGEPPPA